MLCQFDLHLRNGVKRSKLNWPCTGEDGIMARKPRQEGAERDPVWYSISKLMVLFISYYLFFFYTACQCYRMKGSSFFFIFKIFSKKMQKIQDMLPGDDAVWV